MKSRCKELLAMILIGDGALNLIQPRQHTEIWSCGPKVYREAARNLESHPVVARGLGLALLSLGFLLARSAARP
jgi:hypothetical protein